MGPPQVAAPPRKPAAAASFRTHPPATVWGPPQAAVWVSAPVWSRYRCNTDEMLKI